MHNLLSKIIRRCVYDQVHTRKRNERIDPSYVLCYTNARTHPLKLALQLEGNLFWYLFEEISISTVCVFLVVNAMRSSV